MAFFGLFDYSKPGPGVSKDAPKKRGFLVFWEIFFRKFWKMLQVNLLYLVTSLPVVTLGLSNAGLTYITRNFTREKPVFLLTDYFDTIKKNWKQALPAGIINTLVYAMLFFDIYFFWFSSKGIMASLGVGICVCILFIFTVMNYYIWTLMITFKFTLKQIYKNSFKFVFINMKLNLLCFFSLLLVYAVNIGLIFLFQSAFFIVLTLEIFLYILLYPSFRFLLVQFCTFPSIKKYIIDPYYLEHPDEDIDKRRDLGIEVEEEKPQTIVNEDGEEESENVFED